MDAAYLLANVVPRLVTTEINPAASKGVLKGGILDLVERMRSALPVELDCITKDEWLDLRRTKSSGSSSTKSGALRQNEEDSMLMITKESSARIPREVPALPKGHVPRKAILDGIKRMLFSLTPSENDAALENAMLLVQGMGGAGKTVVAI